MDRAEKKSKKERTPQERLLMQQEHQLVQAFRDLVDINKHDEALTLLPRISGFANMKLVPLVNIGFARPDLRDLTFSLLQQELGKISELKHIFSAYTFVAIRHFPPHIKAAFETRMQEIDPNWKAAYEAEMRLQNQQQDKKWAKDPAQVQDLSECLVFAISVKGYVRSMAYIQRYLELGGPETREQYLKARIELERKFYKKGRSELSKHLQMLLAVGDKDKNLDWLRSVYTNAAWVRENKQFLAVCAAAYIEKYKDAFTIEDWRLFAQASFDLNDSQLGNICYEMFRRTPGGRSEAIFRRLNSEYGTPVSGTSSGKLANPVWENLEDRNPINRPAALITDWAHNRLRNY